MAREQAWLEAARRWDRAAERETDAKRKQLYLDKGELARSQIGEPIEAQDAQLSAAADPDRKLLN
jgi:hypothetical protein